jgi:hypothetical protein
MYSNTVDKKKFVITGITSITLSNKELSEINMTQSTFKKIAPFAEAEVQVESNP